MMSRPFFPPLIIFMSAFCCYFIAIRFFFLFLSFLSFFLFEYRSTTVDRVAAKGISFSCIELLPPELDDRCM